MASTSSILVVFVLFSALHMHTGSCGVVDEQSCANLEHKECKCNLNFVISGYGSNDAFCNNLQACADCMAIPRCISGYMDQFKTLLRTTLVMSKNTRICPNINYKTLAQGMSKSCKGNGIVYDHCGNQCQCQNGYYIDCFRVRKEFTQMSFEERRRFVDAYYKATTDPFIKDDLQKFFDAHAEIPTDFLHHMPPIFFPWHRWFLLHVENILQQVDCRVTIPYYQWPAKGKDIWRETDPTDVWNGGPQGIGGNGVPPSHCVKDGKFREGNWILPGSKDECLKRDFNKTCSTLYNQKKLNKLLHSNSFKQFDVTMRLLHSKFHDCLWGSVPFTFKSFNTPEVLLLHGFVDRTWDQWQNKGNVFKFQYYTSINFRMPFADMYPWQFLDNNNLPGDVRVRYEPFKETPHKEEENETLRKPRV